MHGKGALTPQGGINLEGHCLAECGRTGSGQANISPFKDQFSREQTFFMLRGPFLALKSLLQEAQ
jgi:hypothetical protein